MPVECPNCRGPISRFRLFRSTAFGRWRCKHCDALLAVDTRRRLLAIIAAVLFSISVIAVIEIGILPPSALVTFPFLIGATVLTVLAIDRPMLIERAGFRCHACGYDLRGQVVPRCPECGTQLDEQQQALLANDNRPEYTPVPGARLRRRRYITAILVLIVLMTVAGALMGLYAGRRRAAAAARRAAAAKAAVKQASTQPTTKPTTTNPTTAQRAASAPAGEPMP